MVASEHTMTDPVHNSTGPYTNNGDATSAFARPPTSETAPEQQV